jgi:signal transduction histidine kinase
MEEINTAELGRKRRRWRNLWIQPSGQVRLVFALPLIGLLAVEALLMVLNSVLTGRLSDLVAMVPQATSPIIETSDAMRGILLVVMGIVFICAVAFLISALLISHRYYGPLVPLLRTVKGMKEGDFKQRIHLRKGDELHELAEAVNALAESFEAKQELK